LLPAIRLTRSGTWSEQAKQRDLRARFTGADLLRYVIGSPDRFRLRDGCPLWCVVPHASTIDRFGNSRRDTHIPGRRPTTPDRQRVRAMMRELFPGTPPPHLQSVKEVRTLAFVTARRPRTGWLQSLLLKTEESRSYDPTPTPKSWHWNPMTLLESPPATAVCVSRDEQSDDLSSGISPTGFDALPPILHPRCRCTSPD
jgi:hypothetical protein